MKNKDIILFFSDNLYEIIMFFFTFLGKYNTK